MPQEIEKKYLLWEDGIDYSTEALLKLYSSIQDLRDEVLNKGEPIRQGYMQIHAGEKLGESIGLKHDFQPDEARLRDKAGQFHFTLKGEGGLSRNESEEEISKKIFGEFWPQTKGRRIEKIRLEKPYDKHTLEIDVYTDRDLILAEIEVPTVEDAQRLVPLGKDVSEDERYKNTKRH